jgi:DNA repair exonuclease SbcCD ATPase subunit
MTDLDSLTLRAKRRRRELDQKSGEAHALASLKTRTEEEIVHLKSEIVELEKVSMLLTSIAEDQQFKAQEAIETLVTEGLQTIFDDSLSFHILQKVSGKSATVEFVIRTTTVEGRVFDTSVLDARGGGLAAVVGFLLRLVVLLLRHDHDKDNVLVLDETFAHVSDEYLPGLGEFLRQLVDKTGVQVILVTHQSEFMEFSDRVYRFALKDGVTQVRKEK